MRNRILIYKIQRRFVQTKSFNKKKIDHVHFIGLGGAGMSALALILLQRGVRVSGSDLKESPQSLRLKENGANVCIGHDSSNIDSPDVVVISTAIPEKNVELVEARKKGIEVWRRAEMLAYLGGEDKTIAIAGTHGKTSTSSMAAYTLKMMEENPSFCIGGVIAGLEVNAESGEGDLYVVEADESDGSFLYLNPHISVITNLEADHLDHYNSFAEIEDIFSTFMSQTSHEGSILVYGDDVRLKALAAGLEQTMHTYGKSRLNDYSYEIISLEGIGTHFAFYKGNEHLCESFVSLPGEHMVLNATAVLAIADILDLNVSAAAKALSTYQGVHRRFQLVAEVDGITIVDDYGHHPTEVKATLKGAASLGFERIVVAFQSHRYSRTKAFAREFADAFTDADHTILLEVYSAGETPIPGVSARTLLENILKYHPRTELTYLPYRNEVIHYLSQTLRPGDLFITMGAGDVTAFGPELAAALVDKKEQK